MGLPSVARSHLMSSFARPLSALPVLQCERRGGVFRPKVAARLWPADMAVERDLAGAVPAPVSKTHGASVPLSPDLDAASLAPLATSAATAPRGAVAERDALLLRLLLDANALENDAARVKLASALEARGLFSGTPSAPSAAAGGVGGGEGGANRDPNGDTVASGGSAETTGNKKPWALEVGCLMTPTDMRAPKPLFESVAGLLGD